MNHVEKKLKKIDKAIINYQNNIDNLICPVCQSSLTLIDKALQCSNKHTFNFNKKGYVNFINYSNDTIYDEKLFEARANVLHAGLYDHIIDKLIDIIIENFAHFERIHLLDAGCGEGYYLNKIHEKLNDTNTFLGVDLSSHAISKATNYNQDTLLMVANLANLPIANEKIDIILNILSPVNYEQFVRVLNKRGLIVKVIPNANYLKEIRHKLTTKDFDNHMVINLFKAKVDDYQEYNLSQTFDINTRLYESIIEMSPLTSDLSDKKKEALKEFPSDTITIDMKILVGKKRDSDD